MKKSILKAALVAAIAAVASYGVYTNQAKETMSDVMLANVEALARGVKVLMETTKQWDIALLFEWILNVNTLQPLLFVMMIVNK